MGNNTYITGTGQKLVRVHSDGDCFGKFCCIHNPSDHLMRDWPTTTVWDHPLAAPNRGGFMGRVCPHDVVHPDPDDPWADFEHFCDGCCQGMGPDDE